MTCLRVYNPKRIILGHGCLSYEFLYSVDTSQFRSSGKSYSLWSSDVIQLLVQFPNTTIKWTFHKTSPLATWLSILYFLLSFFLFNINIKYLHHFQKGSKRLYVIFSLFQISIEAGLIVLYDYILKYQVIVCRRIHS